MAAPPNALRHIHGHSCSNSELWLTAQRVMRLQFDEAACRNHIRRGSKRQAPLDRSESRPIPWGLFVLGPTGSHLAFAPQNAVEGLHDPIDVPVKIAALAGSGSAPAAV